MAAQALSLSGGSCSTHFHVVGVPWHRACVLISEITEMNCSPVVLCATHCSSLPPSGTDVVVRAPLGFSLSLPPSDKSSCVAGGVQVTFRTGIRHPILELNHVRGAPRTHFRIKPQSWGWVLHLSRGNSGCVPKPRAGREHCLKDMGKLQRCQ